MSRTTLLPRSILIEYPYLIKSIEKVSSILTYLLVLVGGFSMLFMLSVEYREAKRLIDDNQFLMKNTVIKTLTTNISNRSASYPLTSTEIASNWKRLPLNFMANQQGKWLFPFRFNGLQGNNLSTLWQHYDLNKTLGEKELSALSSASQLRLESLRNIKQALKSNDQAKLAQEVENYFSLVENYQLSILEEIISSLRFLQLEEDTRWNVELIQLIVFEGSNQLTPLIDFIFKHNDKLSREDIDLAISKIEVILESANIDASWFNQSINELWKPNLSLNIDSLKEYAIIHNKWIMVHASEGLMLFLPFSIETELTTVEKMLKLQGVLDADDKISIGDTQGEKMVRTIVDLPFDIKRATWIEQRKQQSNFFKVKIALTLTFVISLLVVVAFISYRNKKKSEFIDLRENFINLVSHELKTPLASIRIMIETLQKRHNRNLSIKDYPDKIITEVDRLWLMVDNLLSLNQIKSGELELNLDKVNLGSLVERVYEKFSEYQSKQLIFINNIQSDSVSFVDPLLFELVIINLFSNSIKYCDKSEVKIEASFDSKQRKLIFTDNACGIQRSNWSRVFDDFYRDTSTNAKQGTGVGLSLCKQIMKIHRSSITITASSKNGTTWEIVLPETSPQGKERSS
ncbi:sensor histidine kinase [Aliikangiella sp. IMCC44653]